LRGIQYAAASRINHECRWNTGRIQPVKPGDDGWYNVKQLSRERFNADIASEAKQSILPRKERMDCFASLAMTLLHTSAISRRIAPEVCQ
jgi:hypothetical protein